MTCCVAALCADRQAIVLAADKMIGMVGMESEPDISKIFRLHKNWWVMLAGNGISPAFDIIDHAKRAFSRKKTVGIDEAIRNVSDAFRAKRIEEAEALHLAPIGWTLRKLNSSASRVLPESIKLNLIYQLQSYSLPISLLIVGFDGRGRGQIFSVEDGDITTAKGVPQRHDLPGYYSIGSGSFGALYMMGYRDLSPAVPVRAALYYVAEGKYFGEFASGVGLRTDLYIIRPNEPYVRIVEKAVDKKLMKLCDRLRPRRVDERAVEVLNSFKGKNMGTIPRIKIVGKGEDRKIETE
jgi:20S proteasome alpha/beta subunit